MRFLLILSILAALLGGCSSFNERERQEQQAVDTFDHPVGSGGGGTYADPYGHQPR